MIKILSRSKRGKRQLCSWRKPSSKKTSSLQIPALSKTQLPAPPRSSWVPVQSPTVHDTCCLQLLRIAVVVRWSAGLVNGG